MKKAVSTFFIFILSCKQTIHRDESASFNLTLSLIEQYILTDSLNHSGYVVKELQPYKYYKLKYTDDGLNYPPPSGYEWQNETALIEQIGLNEYFGDSATKTHIRHQIVNSKKLVKRLKLNSLGEDKLGLKHQDDESWYTFYLPLFNADSSAVYMQYDHFDNGYGEGNAAIFIKKKGKWLYLKFLPGWMTYTYSGKVDKYSSVHDYFITSYLNTTNSNTITPKHYNTKSFNYFSFAGVDALWRKFNSRI